MIPHKYFIIFCFLVLYYQLLNEFWSWCCHFMKQFHWLSTIYELIRNCRKNWLQEGTAYFPNVTRLSGSNVYYNIFTHFALCCIDRLCSLWLWGLIRFCCCHIFQIAVIVSVFCLFYYSYYHFDSLHFHAAHGYAHLGYPVAQHRVGQHYMSGKITNYAS